MRYSGMYTSLLSMNRITRRHCQLMLLLLMLLLLSGALIRNHAECSKQADMSDCPPILFADSALQGCTTGGTLCHWDKVKTLPIHVEPQVCTKSLLLQMFSCRTKHVKAIYKSHVEYCGKKMVRAITLQFHPKL